MNIQYLLVLLFACAAGGMTYVLAGEPFRKPLARARMSIAARKGMHAKPTQRMKIAEAIDRAGEAFEKVIPLKLSESRELQDKLDLAGLKITSSTWRAISLGITIFTAIMLAGAALVGGYGIAMALLVGIIGAVGGWAVCGVWLSHAGKTRAKRSIAICHRHLNCSPFPSQPACSWSVDSGSLPRTRPSVRWQTSSRVPIWRSRTSACPA